MPSERRAPSESKATVACAPRSPAERRAWIALIGLVALSCAGLEAYWLQASRPSRPSRPSRSGALSPPPSSARSPTSSTLTEEGDRGLRLHSQGRYAEAVEAYEQALRHGEDASTHARLAQSLEALHRFDEAGAHYRRALSLDPHDAATWYDYGNLLRSQMKDYRGAVEAYRRAIDERPSLAEAHFALGAVLLDIGEPDDAAASIESSLSLAPPNASWRADAEEALLVARTRAAQRALTKPK